MQQSREIPCPKPEPETHPRAPPTAQPSRGRKKSTGKARQAPPRRAAAGRDSRAWRRWPGAAEGSGRRSRACSCWRESSPRCSARARSCTIGRRQGRASGSTSPRRRSPRRSKLAIQHEEDLVRHRQRVRRRQPARLARRVRPLGGIGARDAALPRAPEHRPRGAGAGVAAAGLRSADRRQPRRTARPAHRARAGAASDPARREPRPYYCFAVAGLSRNRATYLPPGVDYCALAQRADDGARPGPQQLRAVRQRQRHDARRPDARVPRWRRARDRGRAPARVRGLARRAAACPTWCWTGRWRDTRTPPCASATRSGSSHVVFTAGSAPAHPQTPTIDLHNGWTVQSFGAPARDRGARRPQRARRCWSAAAS